MLDRRGWVSRANFKFRADGDGGVEFLLLERFTVTASSRERQRRPTIKYCDLHRATLDPPGYAGQAGVVLPGDMGPARKYLASKNRRLTF
jgi:hypothetical protein